MHGERPASMFVVYANAGEAGAAALDEWYMQIHGPDSIRDGTFSALHRYEAVGDYDAEFVALWESAFRSSEEARARILPAARERMAQGRIATSQQGVWTDMYFSDGPTSSVDPISVGTMTVVEGGPMTGLPQDPGTLAYPFRGGITFIESPEPPDLVRARWAARGHEGMAPHGQYMSLFDVPEGFLNRHPTFEERWVSHWRPIGSLRLADLL